MPMYSALHIVRWFSHDFNVFTPKMRQKFYVIQMLINQNKYGIGQKRKLLCCPQMEFLNILVRRLENIFISIFISIFIISLKNTQKYQIWVHFPFVSQKM